MVKKFKAMAEEAGKDSHLASAVKDSAQQIWLAGLGAFAKAQEEGGKVFEALVKEGNSTRKKMMGGAEGLQDVTEKVQKFAGQFAGQFGKQATGTWDKLESVFEERVQRALGRLGVPSAKEVSDLSKRVEELTTAVQKLSGGRAVKAAKAPAKKAAKRAGKSAKAAKSAAQ